jgi:hypothetical protein
MHVRKVAPEIDIVHTSRSPRSKAGSIEPLSTTTIGDGEFEKTLSPFHI